MSESGKHTPKRLMALRNQSDGATAASSSTDRGHLNGGELAAKVARLQSDPTKVHLNDVSYPPSRDELQRFEDLPLNELPQTYKRDVHQRVFCNRSVDLSSIHYVGFDMDYTLAVYKEPAIYELTYGLILWRLQEAGYPDEIGGFKFEPCRRPLSAALSSTTSTET
ncbi:hypothetical protein PTSG_12615 [Salpingoeca rosetta]|uniref:Uncharacterized protein n=1 Tax=Salpingoeca rosetta (strain ATCC 50818 / BSB-021) TaxID=946362 RepID=F2UHD6_SALR5|nr:uncharacterized protein PTSG_12615 [Salpingoeca rosetta]EGD76535.1 hypothetical protein PTSG_12615 [Salpingoeca rosetta]|eukprot:XP_004991449.1 hypothetical protein PTSG_12615 [Salpingoeca rosetta]